MMDRGRVCLDANTPPVRCSSFTTTQLSRVILAEDDDHKAKTATISEERIAVLRLGWGLCAKGGT